MNNTHVSNNSKNLFQLIFSLLFTISIIFGNIPVSAKSSDLYKLYPHWDLTQKETIVNLERIESFIQLNAGDTPIALFDWDGTLVDENIVSKELVRSGTATDKATRSLQSVWHLWGAYHMDDLPVQMFPMFRTRNNTEPFNADLIFKDNYLESKTDIEVKDYNKFTQIATLEAGMSPADMDFAVREFLKEYPPETYLYFPMFDLLQRLVDKGFKVWIVTGSNPYFISTILNQIEKTQHYTPQRLYKFGISGNIFVPGVDQIAGNNAKLLSDGRFSSVYDNRYVKDGTSDKNYVVNYEGKEIAVKNFIEGRSKAKKAYFCAGNSGGDVSMLNYTLKRKESLGIAVNSSGALTKFAEENKDTVISLFMFVK